MKTTRIEEFKVSPDQKKAIETLLRKCFSEYPRGRSYYKQLPSFRYLAYDGDKLIGHMGVEHRMMKAGNEVCSVFGIADICVDTDYQHQKVGSSLIKKLEKLGKKNKVDFMLLMADDHQLYLKNDFEIISNTCRWLMINEHQTLGVGHRKIEDCIMVKSLNGKTWGNGLIDFLGHIF